MSIEIIFENPTRCKQLKNIFSEMLIIEECIRLYCISINKKKDWDSLSRKSKGMKYSESKKWNAWVSKARKNYNDARTNALEMIERAAELLSDSQKKSLGEWIWDSPNSIAAYKKKTLSWKDSVGMIEARVMHILFIGATKKMISVKND